MHRKEFVYHVGHLPRIICNNINVKIHLYCKGLQTDKQRMPCLIMYVFCENTTAEKSEQSTLTKFQRTQPLWRHSCLGPCHEGSEGKGGVTLPIVNLGTWWRSVVSPTTPAALTQGKWPLGPTEEEAEQASEDTRIFWEEKTLLLLPGIKPNNPITLK